MPFDNDDPSLFLCVEYPDGGGRKIDLLQDKMRTYDEGRSRFIQFLWWRLTLRRRGPCGANGIIDMQFPRASVVKQAERGVAPLLDFRKKS